MFASCNKILKVIKFHIHYQLCFEWNLGHCVLDQSDTIKRIAGFSLDISIDYEHWGDVF